MRHANRKVSRLAFELIPGEEEWYEIEGGHSGLLYHPCDRFDEANSVKADFLRSRLTPRCDS